MCVPRGGVCDVVGAPGLFDGDARAPVGAGSAVSGNVSASGGRVSRLYFAVVGDTRPATVDDTGAYPMAIARKIFQDVQSLDPPPLFGISTGDYVFASPQGGQAAAQFDLYSYARSAFSGVMFPAMGNHECTGATASNCGAGNADGITDNYTQFLAKMLRPLGQSKPYYAIEIDSSLDAWTAKFVFVAPNAWDDVQAAWLDATLARPTTYTFIVRHEPKSADTAPGVGPSEAIVARYPHTLTIVGHSHTYARSASDEVIFGNGGAPLTSPTATYGFGLFEQRPDGSIRVDAIDYAAMQRDGAFAFAITPTGLQAP